MQQPLFNINNLQIQTGDLRRLTIKSFDIHRGAIYVVSGKPGSGKTTLLQSLVRETDINTGEILFEGKDIKTIKKSLFRSEVLYIPQIYKKKWTTVEKFMIKVISNTSHRKDNPTKYMDKICKQMSCTYLRNRRLKDLTPGQMRWILLASGIASDTKVMVIDEIEQHMTKEMLKLLTKILFRKSNHDGVSIILSTLNPELLTKIASVNIALSDGRITSVRSSGKKTNKFKK